FLLERDGTVASWNLGAERLKRYRADEIIGHHLSQFYTEDDRRDGVPARALAEALERCRWEGEGWRLRKDGTRFWANVVITSLRSSPRWPPRPRMRRRRSRSPSIRTPA